MSCQRSLILALMSLAFLSAPGLARQRTAPALRTPPPPPAEPASDPNFVTCGPYISMTYVNGTLIVGCTDDSAPSSNYSFQVVPGDNPSAEQVIAYIQPYVMAVKIAQIMPSVGVQMSTPFQSFNQRIGLYRAGSKITGMKMMTAN
jgi:hypothetical protein